jgi:hypothetical protein
MPRLTLATVLIIVGTFFALPAGAQGTAEFQTRKTWSFAMDGVSFSNEFPGARLNEVVRTGPRAYQITISPEVRPINNSAWFAFRVWSKKPESLRLTLAYTGGTHRYAPKVATEGGNWTLIRGVAVAGDKRQAEFALDVSPKVRVVAGQALVTLDEQMAWAAKLAQLPFVSAREIGRSVQNRAVPMLETRTAPDATARTLILMTGQHPPEFTGAAAFRSFLGPLLAETPLAREFRKHFNLAVFPLMNPDGWYHGHWRCNANGIDPNRSWTDGGMEAVPEVRHAMAEILKLPRPVMFIDFHSTVRNVLYTGGDDDREPRFLVPELHAALARRVPRWEWSRDISHQASGPPSRSWGTRVLGIPSVTWELSDTASARRIAEGPPAGAEELMRLLLRLVRDDTGPRLRLDFESPGRLEIDSEGGHHAEVQGVPAQSTEAVSGAMALSLAAAGSHLVLRDFDYGSEGCTLTFWFRMDEASLAAGDATSLFSHGESAASESLGIFHRKSKSALTVRLRTASGGTMANREIDVPQDLVLDGKWHHLGVVVQPGHGLTVYLNGIAKGKQAVGHSGIDPVGPLLIGIGQDQSETERFSGSLDDFRIYSKALSPFDLTVSRFSVLPATAGAVD